MAWRQGFFRIWVVLSVIWVGVAILIAQPKTYVWLWNAPKYEITFPTGLKFTLDGGKTREEATELLDSQIKHEVSRPGREKLKLDDRDELLQSMYGGYSSPGDQARDAWLATLIPPVGLFLVGLTVGWILRGFRKA